MNAEITFHDKSVSYNDFMRDLAARIATFMKEDQDDPPYISQRKAETIYGRANIHRWVKTGAVSPIRRVGRIEYPTSLLKELSRTDEAYIKNIAKKK